MGRLTHRTAPGFTYLVTSKTWESRSIFRATQNAEILTACILGYRDRGFYLLHEFVVMPNHFHAILTPSMETSLEKAMQLIKGGSSHEIHARRQSKMQIWQSGFHGESVRDVADFQRKVNYVRMNPVVDHLADKAENWVYGSGSGRYLLDTLPGRLNPATSGAKAHLPIGDNVGAKAPTP